MSSENHPNHKPITAPASKVFRGIGCVLVASMLITFSDAITKWLGGTYPTGQMLCARSSFFLIMAAVIVLATSGRHGLRTSRPRAHLLRGALATGSAFLFVTSLKYLPLADTITIAFAAPLFLTAMAPYFLSEKVGWRRWSAVLVGFAGVVLMMKPGADTIRWIALLPVCAAAFEAVRDVLTRRMTLTESSLAMVTLTTAVIVVLSAATSVSGWPAMSWTDAGLLAIGGALFGGAHWLYAEALRLAEAVVVAPFRYSPVVWALLLGFMLWGDVPDAAMLAGTALVVASGLYIFYREATIHRRERNTA